MHRFVEEGRTYIEDAISMDEGEKGSLEKEISEINDMGMIDILEEELLYIVEDSYYEEDFSLTIEEALSQAVINAEEAIRAEREDNPFDIMTEGNGHEPFCR